MNSPLKNVLINSTLAFISAFVIGNIIHEFGHYLSYLLYGADPTLFHNYVQTDDQSLGIQAKIVSALAGPVISLIQGVVFGLIVSNGKKNTPGHLFFLWLSLFGFINFFGYLFITPFSTTGDTGKVAELLHVAYSLRVFIAVIGFALLIWIILKIAKNFSNFIPIQQTRKMSSRYVYNLMFFPIIIGSVAITLLAFPAVTGLSILYPATSPYAIMSSFRIILKSQNRETSKSELEPKILKSFVILTLGAILLDRILTFGVS